MHGTKMKIVLYLLSMRSIQKYFIFSIAISLILTPHNLSINIINTKIILWLYRYMLQPYIGWKNVIYNSLYFEILKQQRDVSLSCSLE